MPIQGVCPSCGQELSLIDPLQGRPGECRLPPGSQQRSRRRGDDEEVDYVPVRRLALFLEQTLLANLGWVVFEPNGEPLWAAIRASVESFMMDLFREGAFQGPTPSEAFLVKCDRQTMTQADLDNGIVNILVGFAPIKPTEFVIIQIGQLAGQTPKT
jgi:phage tail sheath protein FI